MPRHLHCNNKIKNKAMLEPVGSALAEVLYFCLLGLSVFKWVVTSWQHATKSVVMISFFKTSWTYHDFKNSLSVRQTREAEILKVLTWQRRRFTFLHWLGHQHLHSAIFQYCFNIPSISVGLDHTFSIFFPKI